jgi:hypothetical protein
LFLTTILLAAWQAGCARDARLTLQQDAAPPGQKDIRLASDWAYVNDASGRREVLLAFPLPGAEVGPRDFLLYLSIPRENGTHNVSDSGSGVSGLLLQKVGMLAGKTTLESGTVECKPSLMRPDVLDLEVNVVCDDGTRIRGEAKMRPSEGELRAFRDAYAVDISLLNDPAAGEGVSRRSLQPQAQ